MTLGDIVVNQQHALSLVICDINTLRCSLASVSSENNARLTNVDKSVNNVVESVNNLATTAIDDCRALLSRIKTLEKLVHELRSSKPDCPVGDRPQQPTEPCQLPLIEAGEPLSAQPEPGSQSASTSSILHNSTADINTVNFLSSTQARKILTENSIRDLLSQILECIGIEISDDISDALLAECHSKKAPMLKQDVIQLNKLFKGVSKP